MKLGSVKPIVPVGERFAFSRQFFTDLGFEVMWESEGLVELRLDGAAFLLQRQGDEQDPPASRFQVEVDDLDAWWQHVQDSGVLERYENVSATEPTDYPWGDREMELIDPAGVCWQFVE